MRNSKSLLLCQGEGADASSVTHSKYTHTDSEATLELKEHVDGVSSLHVIVRDVLLVS